MPIYEYECEECGAVEARWVSSHSLRDGPDAKTPCGCKKNAQMVNRISIPSVKVKGGTPIHHHRAPRK